MLAALEVFDVVVMESSDSLFHQLQQAVSQSGLRIRLHRVSGEQELMAFLQQPKNGEGHRIRPALVVLEILPPHTAGLEFLKIRQERPEFRRIPVVVLSDNREADWVHRTYSLGVNSFIQKPADAPGYLELIQALNRYWFGVVKLPSRN